MLKHNYFKSYLAKATPLQREVATKHFHLLWQVYQSKTSYSRYLYSSKLINLTSFRQVTSEPRREMLSELKERLKLI